MGVSSCPEMEIEVFCLVLGFGFVTAQVVETVGVAKDKAGKHSWWVGQILWNVEVQVKHFL